MACLCEEKKESILTKEFWIKIVRLVLSLTLMLLGYFLFSEERYGVWVNFAVMFTSWLIVSYDVIWASLIHIFKGKNPFDEDLLMIIASIGAFCLRLFGEGNNEFLEAVMVMFLFQVGEMFEDIATNRSKQAITSAVGLRALVAHLLKDKEVNDVKPEELAIGDLIIVKVGEILPADGVVINGSGYVDMSSLTGEPVPVLREVGGEVNSGTILRSGSLTIRVEEEYANNTVSKMIRLVEEGEKSKSQADKFVDKFSRVYTPIVVSLAFLLAIVPPLFLGISNGAIWESWIYRSLSFLVISCPCAIVISVPLAYFSGIGLASKNGIIIKGAAIFDSINSIKTLVSDKTGTLTYGVFKITKQKAIGLGNAEFLQYLKAAESRSCHPIASAILGKGDASLLAQEVSEYNEVAGKGVSCRYKGHHLLAGNDSLLNDNKVPFIPSREVGSIVYLAVDGVYAGYVVCNDVIRKESLDMVEGLHKNGIKICMLTGDKEKNAMAVASTLDIDEYHSELLPEEKTKLLKDKITPNHPSVAYVGDGINDAPSIALADVGYAMGGVGSDLAIQNADVVIMNDNPYKIVTSINVAKATRRVAYLDIIIALMVKLAVMLCAALIPGFPLLIAVISDTGLTMILVIFSISLLFKKVK
jgi:Cd2+/Zn2+-exporting ATPase